MNYQEFFTPYQDRIQHYLEQCLPNSKDQGNNLLAAMRYSVLNGGKRIRPLLTYAAGEALKLPAKRLDACAAAVELIHAYSLVHDDLPAMDDDDLRRNQPTVHIAYDEATAILAGDALQTLAFQLLASDENMTEDAGARVKIITLLTQAAGHKGMAGGQALDMAAEDKKLSLEELQNLHLLKTGELIRASLLMPCYLQAGCPQSTFDAFDRFAYCIGLAFQIRDDILDIEGDTHIIGKPQGSDVANDKSTYPALLGLDKAKQAVNDLFNEAIATLTTINTDTSTLETLAEYIIKRDS